MQAKIISGDYYLDIQTELNAFFEYMAVSAKELVSVHYSDGPGVLSVLIIFK